jgi:acyl phosphate:glycerol-3-phosphate acyltransferase
MIYFYTVLIAFAAGSIPFGYLIGQLFYRSDIREQGSGNIGAMNALRSFGTGGAAAVLVLDALKGFVPTLFGTIYYGETVASIAAAAAVLGHCFSPWLRFRGGKGVATSFGAIVALSPYAGLIAILGWISGALTTGYSSVGSLFGSILAPVALFLFSGGSAAETLYGILALVLIVFTHRENIARLRHNTEHPIHLRRESNSNE